MMMVESNSLYFTLYTISKEVGSRPGVLRSTVEQSLSEVYDVEIEANFSCQ